MEGKVDKEEMCRSCEVVVRAAGHHEEPGAMEHKFDNNKKEPLQGGKRDEDRCGVCNIKVRENDNALSCDTCEIWYHIGCIGVEKHNYEKMKILGDGIDWNCKECKTKKKNLKNELRKLKDENFALRLENEELRKELNDRMTNIEKKIESIEGEKQRRGLDDSTGISSEALIRQVTENVLEAVKEEEEKKKKINNLILYEVQESQKESGQDREEDDKEKCKKIFANGLGMNGVNIEKVVRLGKRYNRDEEVQRLRPRPMLVKLSTKEEKFDILKNAKNLARTQDEVMKKVIITPDRTKKEQEKDKELRNELKRRREAGETGWFIQRGQLKRRNFY